jgi:DNA-binding CsgD family transcriptional regulator
MARRGSSDDLEAQANKLLAAHGGFGKLPAIYTEAQIRRKAAREVSLEETWLAKCKAFEQHTGPTALFDVLTWRQFKAFMDAAPLTDRQYTMLVAWSNWASMREIALAHGCSLGTVYGDLHQAFDVLRRVMPRDPYWGLLSVLADTFGWRAVIEVYDL